MATMLNVYDRQTRKKTAVLQNAFNIVETHELNQIYLLSFSLPSSDEKNKYCLPRHFVRWGDDGELYRIKSPKKDDSNIGIITYECEHVITTLCDSVMFGSYQYGGAGVKTRATIQWLLSQQKQHDWDLDVCDFDRKFEYLWEQENILNALYSIPKEFASPYKWSFDTTVYPWKISLRAIDTTVKPEFYLRARSNILSSGTSADYANICTRIYPLGYGEGVNQLNIKDVNNGLPYLQSPSEIIAQYGIVEKVLVDRRFENAESLKAYAQSMLDVYQTPTMSRTFDVTDLYPLTNYDWNQAEVGKICKMTQDGSIAYITKAQWQRDKAGDLHIDLSTKATDIASSVADLADRVRIESVYAQGATQLYQHSKDANATPSKGMVMSLYFPSEMRQINKVLMRLKLNKFRSYSKTTKSNGGYEQTLSVAESSKEITSQTNTDDASVSVKETPVSSTTQTNDGTESVIVRSQENILTVGMDATANQNLTTTRGGGGSGTTSYQVGDNTINISATTEQKWEYDYNYVKAQGDSGITQYTNDDATRTQNNIETGQATSDLQSHIHYIYDVLRHKHSFNPTVYVYKNSFAHYHDINLSDVGNHNHSFTVGDHVHEININHTHKVTVPAQTLKVPCPKHKHSFTVPAQTLKVPCPKHKHNITIPGWSKTIKIEPHTHDIEAGIFESGNPTAFDIYVGGKKKTTVNATSYNGDITQWLLNDKKQVPRDSWIDIEIRPNDLAYVVSSVFVQGFVQSRGGGNY